MKSERFSVTRAVLTERIHKRTGLQKKDAAACVATLLALVERSLESGDRVKLVGFGHLDTRIRAARRGVHPRTLEPLPIPEARVVVFRPSRALQALLGTAVDDDTD